MAQGSSLIRVGDSPEVLSSLHDPGVLAAIWNGAWSEESLAFTSQLSRDPGYVRPGLPQVDHKSLPANSEVKSCSRFNKDLSRVAKVFRALGLSLLGPGNDLIDNIRIEPQSRSGHRRGLGWHVDGGGLILLAAVAGPTTEYTHDVLDGHPGRGCGSHMYGSRGIRRLENKSVMVHRGADFPDPDALRLVHRRPATERASTMIQGRFLVHLVRRSADPKIPSPPA